MIVARAHYMFDELDGKSFQRLCNVIVPKVLGNEGFSPAPLDGPDGGADGVSINVQGKSQLVSEYKHHKIRDYSGPISKLQAQAISEFENFLGNKYDGSPGPYVFVTNVRRTPTDHKKTLATIRLYQRKGASVEYWDHAKLVSIFDADDQLYQKWIPHYLGQSVGKTLEEIKKEREANAKEKRELEKQRQTDYRKSDEFISVSRKFKTQFIDWDLIAKHYHAFVYLVEPIYIDDRDGVRATIRDLFHIDEDTENKLIARLHKEKFLDITGNVITINKPDEAIKTASQMIQHIGTDLEKVITLIQEASDHEA